MSVVPGLRNRVNHEGRSALAAKLVKKRVGSRAVVVTQVQPSLPLLSSSPLADAH
jgi:hypothetical protein